MAINQRQAYAFDQVPGCAAVVYPQSGERFTIYFEIVSCRVERSVDDINGSWNMVLLPTQSWDEKISADDFIRIFMGDRILSENTNEAMFNIASGQIAIDLNKKVIVTGNYKDSQVQIPWYSKDIYKKSSYLMMYERMFGKVDRVQRIEQQTDQGPQVSFQVSGRSFGSIVQDLTLYYNENIEGLNAINVFYGSKIPLQGSPSEIVKEMLTIILTAVPFPQWELPQSLCDDLNSEVTKENRAYAEEVTAKFHENIQSSPKNLQDQTFYDQLTRLLSESKSAGPRMAYSYLSMRSIDPTAGSNFNRSFMSAQASTTGFFELLKGVSNEFMNELWFDMCPSGVANDEAATFSGKSASPAKSIPTVVFRQRPYDITSEMTINVAPYLTEPMKSLSKIAPAQEVVADAGPCSRSLMDLMPSAITILGASDLVESKALKNSTLASIMGDPKPYIPTVLNYEVGRSGHDRQNGFCVLPMQSEQLLQATAKQLSADKKGIIIDPASIKKYGLRMMETSSFYLQPTQTKKVNVTFQEIMVKFSKVIANWYYLNPWLLNGTITCRFLPDARIGTPCRYIKTRVDSTNEKPRMELFYIQGVSDEYSYGRMLTTTLTVTRGIRYSLEQGDQVSMIKQVPNGLERIV